MDRRHWAVFTDNHSNKQGFVEDLLANRIPEVLADLKGLDGLLFSKSEVDRYMEEEIRHDIKILTAHTPQGLQSMSSGERKKALLTYLVAQKPDFLILDNPFDNLDSSFQPVFRDMLENLATATSMILLISRTGDLLPFISDYAFLAGNRVEPLQKLKELTGRKTSQGDFLEAGLPAPLQEMEYKGEFLITLNNVSVSYYGKPVLRNINWYVRPGEFWELAGKNGSGKTTLLSMITGDNPKGYGQELYLFGQRKGSGESVWEIKKKLGYFTPAMTDRFGGYHSLENMLISGLTDSIGLYIKPTEAQLRLARAWLGLLGLAAHKDSYFHDLTMGMKRLVMCARAMIKHPLLLILDEPTAGLDDESAALFVQLVNKIGRESNTTVIFVSHRKESGLEADAVYQLEMTPEGSLGHTIIPD